MAVEERERGVLVWFEVEEGTREREGSWCEGGEGREERVSGWERERGREELPLLVSIRMGWWMGWWLVWERKQSSFVVDLAQYRRCRREREMSHPISLGLSFTTNSTQYHNFKCIPISHPHSHPTQPD